MFHCNGGNLLGDNGQHNQELGNVFFTSSPPGKFTEERSKTESSLEKVSTFHLFCPTFKNNQQHISPLHKTPLLHLW